MHEHSIASKIIKDANSYGQVESIIIEVGDLAHLPADEMKNILKEKKPNWNIKVISKKALIRCICGYEGEPKIVQQMHDHNIYECPKCSQPLPKILEGEDIIIKEVEVKK
jgi:Zn finger protein HypA/HybF involved in hydrogenase expression